MKVFSTEQAKQQLETRLEKVNPENLAFKIKSPEANGTVKVGTGSLFQAPNSNQQSPMLVTAAHVTKEHHWNGGNPWTEYVEIDIYDKTTRELLGSTPGIAAGIGKGPDISVIKPYADLPQTDIKLPEVNSEIPTDKPVTLFGGFKGGKELQEDRKTKSTGETVVSKGENLVSADRSNLNKKTTEETKNSSSAKKLAFENKSQQIGPGDSGGALVDPDENIARALVVEGEIGGEHRVLAENLASKESQNSIEKAWKLAMEGFKGNKSSANQQQITQAQNTIPPFSLSNSKVYA